MAKTILKPEPPARATIPTMTESNQSQTRGVKLSKVYEPAESFSYTPIHGHRECGLFEYDGTFYIRLKQSAYHSTFKQIINIGVAEWDLPEDADVDYVPEEVQDDFLSENAIPILFGNKRPHPYSVKFLYRDEVVFRNEYEGDEITVQFETESVEE